MIVDKGQPMTGPYVICFNNRCMADYEASGELTGRLKKGQGLVIQGINGAGQSPSIYSRASSLPRSRRSHRRPHDSGS